MKSSKDPEASFVYEHEVTHRGWPPFVNRWGRTNSTLRKNGGVNFHPGVTPRGELNWPLATIYIVIPQAVSLGGCSC
jgi:hypothetical protein